MKNNKKFLIAGGILILIGGILLGTSYGFWKIDKTQKLSNNLTVDCLNLELSDVTDAINLEKTIPITDEEASNLTPYEFKITNKCNTKVYYSVNLELMQIENQLNSNFVAISVDGKAKEILGNIKSVTPTYKGDDYTANEAHYLTNGELGAKEEKTHSLKLWVNQDVTMEDDVMNKRLVSKISVTGGQQAIEKTLVQYLQNLQSEELVEDEFGNLRYIGANPNNYVRFNEELWRIIGVMKDIENADGTKEDKVKLIRSENIGQYSWDNKASGTGSSTHASGSNDWSDSALQKVLNEGAYWNRTSGNCPYGQNGATKTCDFSSTGLTNEAKNMINTSVWTLGGAPSDANFEAKGWYSRERGEEVYRGRPTKWTGKVGLIYISDYGYATAGGATTDRSTCLNTQVYSRNNECKDNTWLETKYAWSITPSSSAIYKVFGYAGAPSGATTYQGGYVYPAIYLNSEILIENNSNGSSTSPFVLKS